MSYYIRPSLEAFGRCRQYFQKVFSEIKWIYTENTDQESNKHGKLVMAALVTAPFIGLSSVPSAGYHFLVKFLLIKLSDMSIISQDTLDSVLGAS